MRQAQESRESNLKPQAPESGLDSTTPHQSQADFSQASACPMRSLVPKLAPMLQVFYSFKVILPVVFFYALSCAVATFIENDYGAPAAHTIIYKSWWFIALHVYLIIALIGSFVRSCAIARKKFASLLLHASFIVIIIGAGITHYLGKEGMMWIEEGSSSNFYYSNDNFINIAALNENWEKDYAQIPANINVFKTLFSSPKLNASAQIFGKSVEIVSQDIALLPDMQSKKNAPMVLRLLISYNGETKPITLMGGNGSYNERMSVREEIGGMKMSFHWGARKVELPFGLRLLEFEKQTYAGTDNPSSYASEVEVLDSEGKVIMPFRIFMNHVLDFGGYRFYQSDYFPNEDKGNYTSVLSVNHDPGKLPTYIGYTMLILGVLWLMFDKKGRFMHLARFLSSHNLAQKSTLSLVFVLGLVWGLTPLHALESSMPESNTPHLESKSSMPSSATTLDSSPSLQTPKNIQTHGSEPESSTLLSQTQGSMQNPSQNLPSNLAQFLADKGLSAEQIQLFATAWNDMQKSPDTIEPTHKQARMELLASNTKEFAARFGKIQVRDNAGRIQPLDTMAMNIIHKIRQKDGYENLTNMQALIGLIAFPNDFASAKLIATKTAKLRKILGTDTNERYVSLLDIYDPATGDSKLHNYFADVQQKSESEWNVFDKDVRQVTQSYEILRGLQSLVFLRIFPDSATQQWFSVTELAFLAMSGQIPKEQYEHLMQPMDSMMNALFMGIILGVSTNSWEEGMNALSAIESYQSQNGGQDYISQSRIEWEIALNHYNVFEALILPYLLLGVIGFIIVLTGIYRDRPIPKILYRGFFTLTALCAIAHTFGLIARWYVADHAPWSNAYESMLYIAWASAMAGVVFFPRFVLALCATNFFAGVSLFVAHLGYMDPQIQNLVPVLKSYWLNIHVSVITAGYGFLGLCFVLGAFTLILFATRKSSKPSIDKAILSISAINEMSMMLGLFMLTIGNFLGAIWANESWGRYWGWDAKETWALISIGIYAIVLHLRFIGFKNMPFIFAAGSVLAFYSILMTYFGVNYYLAGKHSYAAGDPIPVPWGLYVFIALTITLVCVAAFKRHLYAPELFPPKSKG